MIDHLSTKTILTYDDVAAIPVSENGEPLVAANAYDASVVCEYEKFDMIPYTGETILIRESVARKIAEVSGAVAKKGFRLRVVYGYRHPDVQERYFSKRREELKLAYPTAADPELDRLTHAFVAVLDVGGHPTGGAIDLTLIDESGTVADMGTAIADYADTEKMKTFGNGLTDAQILNRSLLHDAMVSSGFAPFYGEWWHFSYGDREWAAFYGKDTSIYGPTVVSAADQ